MKTKEQAGKSFKCQPLRDPYARLALVCGHKLQARIGKLGRVVAESAVAACTPAQRDDHVADVCVTWQDGPVGKQAQTYKHVIDTLHLPSWHCRSMLQHMDAVPHAGVPACMITLGNRDVNGLCCHEVSSWLRLLSTEDALQQHQSQHPTAEDACRNNPCMQVGNCSNPLLTCCVTTATDLLFDT